jgi:hypothetical protein
MIKRWQNKKLWAADQVQLIDENGNIGESLHELSFVNLMIFLFAGNAQELGNFFSSIPSETVSVVSVIGELRFFPPLFSSSFSHWPGQERVTC